MKGADTKREPIILHPRRGPCTRGVSLALWMSGRSIAFVRIPVEIPSQDPFPVPDQQSHCIGSVPFSRRASKKPGVKATNHDSELSLQLDGTKDSLSWLLDAKLSNSCALNFRGTPFVRRLRVRVPLYPQPLLPAICLELVYSCNSSEN